MVAKSITSLGPRQPAIVGSMRLCASECTPQAEVLPSGPFGSLINGAYPTWRHCIASHKALAARSLSTKLGMLCTIMLSMSETPSQTLS